MPGDAALSGVAVALARRLARDAIGHEDRCTWTGDDVELGAGGWETVHCSVGHDLYGGCAGIGLFLAHAARAAGDPGLEAVAGDALRQALWLAEQDAGEPALGLYDGLAGTALAAARVAALLDDPGLGARARDLAERVAGEVRDDPLRGGFDVISGAAGTLVALLDLSARLGSPACRSAADACGDALVAAARRHPWGWDWSGPSDPAGGPGLCGLAHGAGGVAWALLELHAAGGDPAHRHAALEAVRHERSWMDRRAPGWPDLRSVTEPGATPACSGSWCHGAVGIGLARLADHELTGSDAALADVGTAIAAARIEARRVAAAPPESAAANLSLCHGLSGVAELLLSAGLALGVPEHVDAARRVGHRMAARALSPSRWRCGLPEGGEAPGLMMGLAGIGACLLRLGDPAAMPELGLLRPALRARATPVPVVAGPPAG